MQNNVHVLISLTICINFCSQIFYKFHKLFPYESPESKFDLAIKNVKVNSRSSLEHFWGKIFKTFNEILCSKIFPCLILPKNKSRSLFELSWYYSSTQCYILSFKAIDALYTETGWETLESRRNKHKLTLFYKMKSGMSPHYLTTLIPPIVGNTSTYNLRNANDIGMVHANSQLYYNSFLPSVIRKWTNYLRILNSQVI